MKRNGTIIVLHLAVRYPFAGVIWQLLHHLIGFRALGLEVYYLEDHGAYVYDPIAGTVVSSPDAGSNMKLVGDVLDRFGFTGRWGYRNPYTNESIGMTNDKCLELMREADAVFNLCGASEPREEHFKTRNLVYLETDPGQLQVRIQGGEASAMLQAKMHRLFFTYGYNIGEPDCVIPTAGINWRKTRPPVLLDQWHPGVGPASPVAFTTVGTWRNNGKDVEIGGDVYSWSKHGNFEKVLEVARRAHQPIEIATDLASGPDYDRALAGGFSFRPVIPMSLDIGQYHDYVSSSRGEFTPSKDLYVRTHSGWFSDRTVCYLAAGRPAVTQFTGFEKYLPSGAGLLGFHDSAGAIEAIREVNSNYPRHARAAREIACECFDAMKVLDEIAETVGL